MFGPMLRSDLRSVDHIAVSLAAICIEIGPKPASASAHLKIRRVRADQRLERPRDSAERGAVALRDWDRAGPGAGHQVSFPALAPHWRVNPPRPGSQHRF